MHDLIRSGRVLWILSHVSKGLVISGVLLSIYNADLDLYKNPSKIIELVEVSREKRPVFEQLPIIQIGCQSCSAMTGDGWWRALFNSNSYKLLDISDENLKRENLLAVLDIWKYRVMTSETRGNKHLELNLFVISCNFQVFCRLGHQRFIKVEWLTILENLR